MLFGHLDSTVRWITLDIDSIVIIWQLVPYNQMSLDKSVAESVECIPEWPVRGTAKSAPFFDNLSGDKRVLENDSRRLFSDAENMNLEACTISSRGMWSRVWSARYLLTMWKAARPRSCKASTSWVYICRLLQKITCSRRGWHQAARKQRLRVLMDMVPFQHQKYCQLIHHPHSTDQVFTCPSFVSQPTSRARFSISECAMKTLLTRIGVFSSFINILSCFGFENGPNQDGRGGFYEDSRKDKTGALSRLHCFLHGCIS